MAAPVSKRRKTSSQPEDEASVNERPKFTATIKSNPELTSILKKTKGNNSTSLNRKTRRDNGGAGGKSIDNEEDHLAQGNQTLDSIQDGEHDTDEEDEYDLDENVSSEDEQSDDDMDDGFSSGDEEKTAIEKMIQDKNPSSMKRKRNDPELFSQSMSKILSSHLTTTLRKDPILVRSKHVEDHIDDSKLEAKAKRLLSMEKKKEMDKDRIKDVIPKGDIEGDEVKKVMEREKALRKIAQRGVVKLFNAVRAAQIKGEEAAKSARSKGVVGIDTRQTKVTEMSKQGFLDMIQAGGKSDK